VAHRVLVAGDDKNGCVFGDFSMFLLSVYFFNTVQKLKEEIN